MATHGNLKNRLHSPHSRLALSEPKEFSLTQTCIHTHSYIKQNETLHTYNRVAEISHLLAEDQRPGAAKAWHARSLGDAIFLSFQNTEGSWHRT